MTSVITGFNGIPPLTKLQYCNQRVEVNFQAPSKLEQIVFNWTDEIAQMTSIQKHRLDLLLSVVKHYVYTFKIFFKNPNISELKSKIKIQWQIEYCLLT